MTEATFVTTEQMNLMLEAFFQKIPTKQDLEKFATFEDISRLEKVLTNLPAAPQSANDFSQHLDAEVLENQVTIKNIRQQIQANQTAIDDLFHDLSDNKRAIEMVDSRIKDLIKEIQALRQEVGEIRKISAGDHPNYKVLQNQFVELMHNVDSNTRVISKLAVISDEIHLRVTEMANHSEIPAFREEVLERFDGLIKRLEDFVFEQASIKVALKRFEKLQIDEVARNDEQDQLIKKAQEKITVLEKKAGQGGG
jgi:prophage DNA circulation protein